MSIRHRDRELRSQNYASCGPPARSRSIRGRSAVASLVVAALLAPATPRAVAQNAPTDGTAARIGAIEHAQKMRRLFPDIGVGAQATPFVIPELEIDRDPGGAIASFQPNGPTLTAKNGFFQNLGTNGRTCFTCHQPQDGWSLSAQHARDRFYANPNDPLFRLVDGANCPSDDVSTHRKQQRHIICR